MVLGETRSRGHPREAWAVASVAAAAATAAGAVGRGDTESDTRHVVVVRLAEERPRDGVAPRSPIVVPRVVRLPRRLEKKSAARQAVSTAARESQTTTPSCRTPAILLPTRYLRAGETSPTLCARVLEMKR